ncbi:hypothetical protein GC163_14635 [bacterium]|nr:hypothetical protein [bacterium]
MRYGFYLTVLTLTIIGSLSASLRAQDTSKKAKEKGGKARDAAAVPTGVREYTSRNFVVRTDLTPDETKDLLERLETMITQVGRYWGKPNAQIIEMYVVKKPDVWPEGFFPPEAWQSILSGGGLTMSQTTVSVDRFAGTKTLLNAKSIVYAVADRGTPQHEAVHAYCVQTFGTSGPTWFAEGIAELGNYWRDKDVSVQIHPGVMEYLQNTEPVPLTEIVDLRQTTGDSWQNYAWRWALCHMLAFNPNYAARFRPLGLSILAEGNQTFESVYGSMAPEISFEYLQFLEHLDQGYRVDLCSWDWKTKAIGVRGKSQVQSRINAGRGWQATRLLTKADQSYAYTADGEWQLGKEGEKLTADGDEKGQGKLVGVIFDDYKLSEPFELGREGRWTAPQEGALFVRCQDEWNNLADNNGTVTLKLKLAE